MLTRYAYALAAGRAIDIRFVANDYVLKAGELEGVADVLPSIDSLSTAPVPSPVPAPTLQDVIAVLTPQQQSALAARLAAQAKISA